MKIYINLKNKDNLFFHSFFIYSPLSQPCSCCIFCVTFVDQSLELKTSNRLTEIVP